MKKFFKALALVLALALVIGVVPAQATSAKIKAKKTLYVDGAKGTSTDGKLTSGYKSRVAIYKLAGDKKSVAADHTYKAVIKSGDSVTKTKKYVYAADLGKSVVEIFKDGESLGTSVITVKKNATDDTLTVTGFEDGQEVVCGVKTTVTLPRKGVDSDERRLYVDGELQTEVEGQARVYEVTFKKAGDHKIKFEAFQSAELDKATASKEITVKAVMPQPVSAKQKAANSFEVEFEGDMTDLIATKDITNQMIYYLIQNTPVVTGVVKEVKVEGKVVTVTMYANFNSDTDYYFAYGSVEPIKFHTAKNDIKYATDIKLIPAKAYYVGAETDVTYKFYNADGVELDITDTSATLSCDSEVAYLVGSKIYFYKEGSAKITAQIVTGYDEVTNEPNKLTDTITVNGVTKTTTQTAKKYSFGADASKEIHTIRVGVPSGSALNVVYTLSDDSTQKIDAIGSLAQYTLQSTDETVAMINGSGNVVGVKAGSATIVLYDGDKAVDAFPVTVEGKNKVANAEITLSKETLNEYVAADTIKLTIKPIDLDGNKGGDVTEQYSVVVKQADNNADAVKVLAGTTSGYTLAKGAHGAKDLDIETILPITDNRGTLGSEATKGFATVRLVVTVKDEDGTTVATKNVSFVLSYQDTPDAWRVAATKTSLDSSEKVWSSADPAAEASVITVNEVKATSYGDFVIRTNLPFTIKDSIAQLPATGSGADVNYIIRSYPSDQNSVDESVANQITVKAFKDNATHGKAGTYTFTGVHVKYDANKKSVRTMMGTTSVVIGRNDVKANVTVKNGKQENFKNNIGAWENIFKATWDGKNSDDHNSIVDITAVNYKVDATTGAYYVDKVTVTVTLSGTYKFNQVVTVDTLFKD